MVPEAFPHGTAAGGQLTQLRVLTVTPNPSVDLLFETDGLVWDDANRMAEPRRRPGGQGVNVARALRVLDSDATAAVLLGGRTGLELQDVLAAEGVPLRVAWSDDDTRTFVGVRERSSGRSLLLNSRGPARSAEDARRLADTVVAAIRDGQPHWVAGCGSLPAAFPPDFYLKMVRTARASGARIVVDCDGEALRLAAAECDLLVPNQHEAERLLGAAVENPADAARALLQLGPPIACITLGPHGAVLATAAGCWEAVPPRIQGGSTVGAGDTFLAGLLSALHERRSPPDALRIATAAAAAVLTSEGAALLDPARARELVNEVEVTAA